MTVPPIYRQISLVLGEYRRKPGLEMRCRFVLAVAALRGASAVKTLCERSSEWCTRKGRSGGTPDGAPLPEPRQSVARPNHHRSRHRSGPPLSRLAAAERVRLPRGPAGDRLARTRRSLEHRPPTCPPTPPTTPANPPAPVRSSSARARPLGSEGTRAQVAACVWAVPPRPHRVFHSDRYSCVRCTR